jgi:aryl-alcohol dehydrogenase-like predicted oxidoreductase
MHQPKRALASCAMSSDVPDAEELPTLLPGHATGEGTRRFSKRQSCADDHFERPDELWLSSIALGTLRGAPGGIDDLLYRSVVADFLEWSGNVFNTALSDRTQTSERAIGHALRRAIREQSTARDEVVVVSKGGQLTPDPEFARNPNLVQRDLYSSYIDSGILDPSEVTRGHSMAPRFLLDQIQRSRRNLGLETIDYYLIQEPEIHLRALGADGFRTALQTTFEAMELAVSKGWISAYGLATWDGFLLPDSDRSHLSIVDLFDIALDVGSADHHLRALQLPYGLAMGEGAVLESQLGPDGNSRAILDSLQDTGTVVFASAPLYGGRLLGHIPPFVRNAFPDAPSDATTALQFVRSTANVTTAVVGMREAAHVEDNMRLRSIPRAKPELPARLFAAAHGQSTAQA